MADDPAPRRCPGCSAENPVTARFCQQCGQSLIERREEQSRKETIQEARAERLTRGRTAPVLDDPGPALDTNATGEGGRVSSGLDEPPEPLPPIDDVDRALDSVFGWLRPSRRHQAESLGATKRMWHRQIPGFRSGTWWKQVLAVLGYLWIVSFILGLGIYSQPAGALFGLTALAAIFFGTDAFQMQDRLTQGRRGLQGTTWLFLAVVGISSLSKIPAEPRVQQASAVAVPTTVARLAPTAVAVALTPTPLPATAAPTVDPTKAAVATADTQATISMTATAAARPHLSPEQQKAMIDHLGAANSFITAKNYQAAIKQYQAVLDINPDDQDVRRALGDAVATEQALTPPTATPVPEPTAGPACQQTAYTAGCIMADGTSWSCLRSSNGATCTLKTSSGLPDILTCINLDATSMRCQDVLGQTSTMPRLW